MNLDAVLTLARHTPIADLCEAWNLSPATVQTRLYGLRPLTIRELGGLADIHGTEVLLEAINRPVDDVSRRQAERVGQ